MSKEHKEYLVRRAPLTREQAEKIPGFAGYNTDYPVHRDTARLDCETAPQVGEVSLVPHILGVPAGYAVIPNGGLEPYKMYPVTSNATISDLVDTRETTHGDFDAASDWLEKATEMLETMPNWEAMAAGQRQSLRMVVLKISRVGHGDFAEPDHYRDIAGYATLALRSCRKDADKEVS